MSTPVISVVIATYARPARLAECLQAFEHIDFPRDDFEIVVSDDGSPDPLEHVVDRFRPSLNLRYVRGPNTGPGGARNRGVAAAHGEFVAFMDDDCVPDPGWLAELTRHLRARPDAVVAGRIVNALRGNPFATTTQLIVNYVYEGFTEAGRLRLFNPSFAVSAAAFRAIGGFSDDFPVAAGEDHDFAHRWQHAGGATVYAPDAIVYHAHNLTLLRFMKQHYGYGRGLFTFRRKMSARTGQRVVRPQRLGFYTGLVRYPLRQHGLQKRWLHCGLMLLSQAATLVGAVRQAVADRLQRRSAR